MAIEDTLHTEVPEVLVRAPRVTLDEILERVARGEARRESLITDESFLTGIRVMREVTNTRREPRLVQETVWRVFRKQPDKVRSLPLRRREPKPPKSGARADVDLDFNPGMGEEIVNFAFRPDARDRYRFRIVGRDVVSGHLIYRIHFEPRSALDPFAPSGLVWVDTNDFVIVREEVRFERSPVPLVMKSIDRMVVERDQVQGHWVLSRVLLRAELTLSIPTFGSSFDVAMHFSDYKINAGIDDAVFGRAAR
ncbi:MAG: hypothetical protein E6K80_05890 [Candidatus Eisenbacteria bacterium]|uniref:Outer membrane lipoprotein-sorting protein n=1 Tax=Eiseniibacteriota bacterium TaxID=2212470 RepID=A0A538U648_UNCEI|nr:MAG: hypothetical protein E6K80_05890 [Candidatus Eisenbacteria bacterium]